MQTSRMKRFTNKEEMKPLLDICRAGRVFEVQDWIKAGKPVNPPAPIKARKRPQGPMEVAVTKGIYSLVQVLLEGGANKMEWNHSHTGRFSAMRVAVHKRRLDIIELLMQHGASVDDVSMWEVFNTWDRDIMRYFIEHGADVETDSPVAQAFCSKVQRALMVVKEYEDRFPEWKRQLNIALRFHTAEHDEKWVSLMLWAGADPFEPGPTDPDTEPEEYDKCAIEIALGKGWLWFLEKIGPLKPTQANVELFLQAASMPANFESMKLLVEQGFLQQATAKQRSSLIGDCVHTAEFELWGVGCHYGKNDYTYEMQQRASFKNGMMELLLQNGVKWAPSTEKVKQLRRCLLVTGQPGFKAFLRLIKKYDAASKETLRELTRTPTAKALLSG